MPYRKVATVRFEYTSTFHRSNRDKQEIVAKLAAALEQVAWISVCDVELKSIKCSSKRRAVLLSTRI